MGNLHSCGNCEIGRNVQIVNLHEFKWLYSFAYFAFGVTAAYLEIGDEMQGIPQLASSIAAKVAVYVMALNLVLILLTTLGDWRITVLNRKFARERKLVIFK